MAHVDVSSFALKANFTSLKTEVVKLDIDKLAPVPVDLSKLSDVVKNDFVKKTEYDKLVTKFVLNATYDTDKSDVEKKISDAEKKNS